MEGSLHDCVVCVTDSRNLISLDSSHVLAIPTLVRDSGESSLLAGPYASWSSRALQCLERCTMRFSCPICGRGILKPLSGGKTIYLFEGDEPRVLGKSGLYSCGSNGHIVVIPTERNGILQMSETNSVPAAPGKKRFLNTWKEIATYMGRGVRTVQRWERELGLPVRRPRENPGVQ